MRALFNFTAAAIVAMTVAAATSALADENIALVIGNGDYMHAPDADTAERDATAVAEALSAAGWSVTKGTNLDRFAMRRVITRFAAKLNDAEQIVIFYSGHALRTGGRTYLAPVNAQAGALTDVLFDSVPLDLLLQLAAEKPGKSVIFVDGAQLRGFRPQTFVEPGLATLNAPEGVFIVSAAEPGRAVRRSRWRDSRFARLIVDQFLQPGTSVNDVAAKAGPPTYSVGELDRGFALVPAPEGVDEDGLEAEIELAYWRAAERSGRAEDYREYLRRYPKGFFADFARERLGLTDKEEPVPEKPKIDPRIQAERDLNLSRIRKRKIQTYLSELGFDPRGIDGLFGRGTRRALVAWQKKNGINNAGWLTADQVALLTSQGEAAIAERKRREEEARRVAEAEDNAYWAATGAKGTIGGYRAYLEKYPAGMHAKIARAALAKVAEAEADRAARRERRVWNRARKRDTAEAYRDYLGAYPEGIYRDTALARLDQIEGAERAAADIARLTKGEEALRLSPRDQLSIERRLRRLGFPVGKPDGVFDERTRAAIKAYQASRELRDTGYLNRPTVVAIVRDTAPAGEDRKRIDGAAVIEGLLKALENR